MKQWIVVIGVLMAAGFLGVGCGQQDQSEVIATFALDDLNGLVDRDEELTLDHEETADGDGALCIDAQGERLVKLFEVETAELQNVRLVYTAQIKCIGIFGAAYLEMWCDFTNGDSRSSLGTKTAADRKTDWTTTSTHLDLREGEIPRRVRLNCILSSGGHVWLNDIELTAEAIPEGED
ncbi:MAG: hypothetical protein ABIF77_02495 [bacterium]